MQIFAHRASKYLSVYPPRYCWGSTMLYRAPSENLSIVTMQTSPCYLAVVEEVELLQLIACAWSSLSWALQLAS